jgi:hypothetical protein
VSRIIRKASWKCTRQSLDPEPTNNPVDDLLGTGVLGALAGHESGTGSNQRTATAKAKIMNHATDLVLRE